jgi:retron-type reverse transcriptase
MSELVVSDPIYQGKIYSYRSYLRGGTYEGKFVGVPQGGSMSPLLAILTLEHQIFMELPGKVIMYADDGLIYGDFSKLTDRQRNYITKGRLSATVSFNKEKTHIVKQNGM